MIEEGIPQGLKPELWRAEMPGLKPRPISEAKATQKVRFGDWVLLGMNIEARAKARASFYLL